MNNRKKREIVSTDTAEIIENAEKTSYSDYDKARLKAQAFRLNDEMVNQQIGIPELVKKTGISQGAISQYKTGKVLIKEELLLPLCKALGVSRNYLRGTADVKRYDNEDLNQMFGLTDDSISTMKNLKNKELLNLIFENDEIEVDFLLEQTMKYMIAKNKLNTYIDSQSDNDRLDYDEMYLKLLGDMQYASFNMSQEYIRLIDRNVK